MKNWMINILCAGIGFGAGAYRFDCDHGYNSCGLLARLAYTSDQLTDNENAYEIEQAIDQIVKTDPLNLYRKVKKTLPDGENDTNAA